MKSKMKTVLFSLKHETVNMGQNLVINKTTDIWHHKIKNNEKSFYKEH